MLAGFTPTCHKLESLGRGNLTWLAVGQPVGALSWLMIDVGRVEGSRWCKKAGWAHRGEQASEQHSYVVLPQLLLPGSFSDSPQWLTGMQKLSEPFPPQVLLIMVCYHSNRKKDAIWDFDVELWFLQFWFFKKCSFTALLYMCACTLIMSFPITLLLNYSRSYLFSPTTVPHFHNLLFVAHCMFLLLRSHHKTTKHNQNPYSIQGDCRLGLTKLALGQSD